MCRPNAKVTIVLFRNRYIPTQNRAISQLYCRRYDFGYVDKLYPRIDGRVISTQAEILI